MFSPRYLFFGLSGSGTVGLLACWLIQENNPTELDTISHKSTSNNLAELSSNTEAFQSNKKIEEECGEYIWNSSSSDTRNSKGKNSNDYIECEKRIDKEYYPNLINN